MREGTTKDRDMWKDKREAQRGRKREKRWKVKGCGMVCRAQEEELTWDGRGSVS